MNGVVENTYFLWCILFHDIVENNHGGAIYLSRGSANLSVFNDEFIWCRLTDISFAGGAIYADVKLISISFSSFERCYAYDQGATFYIDQKTEVISTSHISIYKIDTKEQEVKQDVCQMCGTASNANDNGNISKCSVSSGYIFTLFPSSGIEAFISYFNFEQMYSTNGLYCAVYWVGFDASFSRCNFLRFFGYSVLHFYDNPTVKFGDSTFSDVFVGNNNVGQSVLSYSNINVEKSTLASLLGVPNPILSARTVKITIKSSRACECTRGRGGWNEKRDHLIAYIAVLFLSDATINTYNLNAPIDSRISLMGVNIFDKTKVI